MKFLLVLCIVIALSGVNGYYARNRHAKGGTGNHQNCFNAVKRENVKGLAFKHYHNDVDDRDDDDDQHDHNDDKLKKNGNIVVATRNGGFVLFNTVFRKIVGDVKESAFNVTRLYKHDRNDGTILLVDVKTNKTLGVVQKLDNNSNNQIQGRTGNHQDRFNVVKKGNVKNVRNRYDPAAHYHNDADDNDNDDCEHDHSDDDQIKNGNVVVATRNDRFVLFNTVSGEEVGYFEDNAFNAIELLKYDRDDGTVLLVDVLGNQVVGVVQKLKDLSNK